MKKWAIYPMLVMLVLVLSAPLALAAEDSWETPDIQSQADYDLAVEVVIEDYANQVIDKEEYYSRRTTLNNLLDNLSE